MWNFTKKDQQDFCSDIDEVLGKKYSTKTPVFNVFFDFKSVRIKYFGEQEKLIRKINEKFRTISIWQL